jgi:hypothetical protein
MASKKKLLQAAAGSAGAEALDIDDVFSTYLYEGTGSSFSINNNIDLNGEGGLVWLKERTSVGSLGWHSFFDTARGTAKYLSSNNNSAEASSSGVTAFNSNGFTLGDTGLVNQNTGDFVSWTFRKAPKFFDVVTYSGQNTDLALSHNLGVAPGMVIVKRTNTTGSWAVYHRSLNLSDNLILNNTGDTGSNNWWTTTAPTDTTFNLLGNRANTNQSGSTYVAYLFAHNDGDGEFGPDSDQDIIKCGSYTGVSATEISVDLGFEPQWVMIKRATSVSLASYASWFMQDTMRGMVAKNSDAKDNVLYANKSSAEGFRGDGTSSTATEIQIHPNATGFTVPSTNSVEVNQAGETYIYMAIRRGPLAAPESATDVFAIDQQNVSEPYLTSGFPVDFAFQKRKDNSSNWMTGSRLQGARQLNLDLTSAEANETAHEWDYMDGFRSSGYASDWFGWMWKRAPSYFDVVAYTGSGGASQSISHNLGVVPEMIWVKDRGNASNWSIYHSATGISKVLNFETNAAATGSQYWGTAAHTSSVFKVGSDTDTGGSGRNYIAYLFASLDGISKVGSFTSDGTDMTIDCGFSSGAKLVVLKKTNATDPWWIWDSTRGIVAGNDPRLKLDSGSNQSTGSDNIDPDSSGFIINNNILGGSGNSFIFYAIA